MVVKTGGGGTEEDGDQEMGTKKWGGSIVLRKLFAGISLYLC